MIDAHFRFTHEYFRSIRPSLVLSVSDIDSREWGITPYADAIARLKVVRNTLREAGRRHGR